MAEVFVSYSSRDRKRVLDVIKSLESAGVRVWADLRKIDGGMNYGPEIVRGIKECKVVMLMCSDSSMRSRNVKQEIQLAWKYERPYLPVLLERTKFPEQLQYWLEGWQWIEIVDAPKEKWWPQLERALANADVALREKTRAEPVAKVEAHQPGQGLEGLLRVARFTDQLWPMPAERVRRDAPSGARGLGAPQEAVRHGHPLGSRLCLAIEADREAHLLLLDRGPEGIIYCLCPSHFAPSTRLPAGRSYLPQERSHYDSFVVSGKPGRENLLAILTDRPLELDWMPTDPGVPARVLDAKDIDLLLGRLRDLEGDAWTALSTYFEVLD